MGRQPKEYELIKANLNLQAVLKNLEEVVEFDPESAALARTWEEAILFRVHHGPSGHLVFRDGRCTVGQGKPSRPSIVLFFLSPAHFNRMMEGKAKPIPLKGFSRLSFLTKDLPRLTNRLEYFLRPTPDLTKEQSYLELNTRLTLTTAAMAVSVLGALDPLARLAVAQVSRGLVNLKVLPRGPEVWVGFEGGRIEAGKGAKERPSARMEMKGYQAANDFLNGRLDPFTAVASGQVLVKGQLPLLESLSLILDRIPVYLS